MRAWEPFQRRAIRLFGTNKTTRQDNIGKDYGRKQVVKGNCLDTVRGCPFGSTNGGRGCWWGCYAKEAVLRYHKLFDVPVSMGLREDLLRRDLRELKEDWVRIGVMGEPSCDWALTLRVARICADEGKRVVIVSRLLRLPSDEMLDELARLGVVLNLTMSSLDLDWDTRLRVARRYDQLGGRAVVRLVSFAFADGHLRAEQDLLKHLAYLDGLPVLEQPARLQRTNPTFELVRAEAYHPCAGYVSGAGLSRWLTAGRQFNPLLACSGYCPNCPHKCLSV